ncbi:MAG: hypothetical protein KatS3mg023_3683 [Armatimonadota bacterium]|nr:MAG: hypothetical protein KatS3mg023_3683 [Armatimonadota bacterium]
MRFNAIGIACVLLFAVAMTGGAQKASNAQQNPLSVSIEVSVPSPLRPGSSGAVIARIRNVLTPRQPVKLQATATYEYAGQTYTAVSNEVTIQVVQPVDVKQVNLQLPPGVILGTGITLPINVNVTLMEGQEQQIQIPIVIN